MVRLAAHRFFPINSEPMQVVEDRGLELRLAAGAIDVLDAEQETAACLARDAMTEQCRVGMAEMEKACRARRESRNNLGSEGEGHGGQE